MLRAWHHSSLTVSDIDLAADFFAQAFGFTPTFTVRDMDREIASIVGVEGLRCDLMQLAAPTGDHVLELIAFRHSSIPQRQATPQPLQPGQAHVCLIVEDLDAALARVEALGARKLGAITEFSEGRAAYCLAPGGTVLELEELYESEGADDGE